MYLVAICMSFLLDILSKQVFFFFIRYHFFFFFFAMHFFSHTKVNANSRQLNFESTMLTDAIILLQIVTGAGYAHHGQDPDPG